MRGTIVRWVGVVAVLGLAVAPVAPAAEGDPPCLTDVKRLCGLVPPTGSFVQGCLERHRSELSKECRAVVSDLTRQTTKVASACRWDLTRFCSNVANAAGEHASCLLAHRDELSPKCREALLDEPVVAEPAPDPAPEPEPEKTAPPSEAEAGAKGVDP
jgi:hypothetical protein